MNRSPLQEEISCLASNIFDAIQDGILILDPNARILSINQFVCEKLQVKKENLIGKTTGQLVKEGLIDRSLAYQVIETQQGVRDITHLTRNGEELMARCVPLFNEEGALQYLVSTVTGVTEINHLKELLKEEKRQNDIYVKEIKYLRSILNLKKDFVFESPGMRDVLEKVKKIASMDSTVFITGESGVGKDVIAEVIHMNSQRTDAPFVSVSIPAIPENLLESELFGFEEGAFTGSRRGGKDGLLKIAEGGTLFLDEVGDIPYKLQVKILKVIETGEINKVGGVKKEKLDVRIIAATNKDVELEIKKGNFREDLYYRLNVVPLKIMPLRERPEAIWPLSFHFLARLNQKYNMQKHFSTEALDELKKYKWPGNIRELKNVVERIAVLSSHDAITLSDVRSIIGHQTNGQKASNTLLHEYEAIERSNILSALKQAKGNKTKAAEILGITRTKLHRKLNQSISAEGL